MTDSKFIGCVFGDFKVLRISEEHSKDKGALVFECQCLNCGNIEYKTNDTFNKTKCLCRKCNKNWGKRNTESRYKDYTNQKIGQLLVLEYLGISKDNKNNREWKCLCDCGNECVKTSNYLRVSKNAMCSECYSNFLSKNTHESRIKHVAKECNVEYFDGYAVINGITKVDVEDVERILAYKRNVQLNSSGYVCIYYNDQQLFIHRIVMDVPEKFNNEDQIIVDHINGDRTDNRKSNLRIMEKRYNAINCKTYKNNTTGKKGVHWNKKLQKWTASIQLNKKNLFLGVFEDYNDAVEAREQAERDLFGEFNRAE